MIEFTDFAKNITRIFNSEYGLRLKYDLTTKLVCEILDAGTVSILLYDSKEDVLVCKGCYIEPHNINLKTNNKDLRLIIDNISVFDFLKAKELLVEEHDAQQLYSEFIQTAFNKRHINELTFLTLFYKFRVAQKLYNEYKNIFQKEKYTIDNKTITGDYFKSLLDLKTVYSAKVKICDLSRYPLSYKRCSNLLKNDMDIVIDDNGYYIGLPLYATERYFGVLRILYSKKKIDFLFEANNEFILTDELRERLANFSQIISLHLETNYYLEGYKKLSSINETITQETISNLNKTCEILSEVVNCNGAMIRLYDESNSEPEIKGHTKNLARYVSFLKTYNDPEYPRNNKFSTSIVSLFKNNKSIMAANFDTEFVDAKKINVFRINEENSVKEHQKEFDIKDLRSPLYRQKLDDLNIKQITIVPIPNIVDSYMVLTNTKNRKFIASDVEMIILAIRGIGLEIKHIQDSQKIKEQQQAVAQTESMRNVIHQVGAPLNGVLLHANNLVNGRVPDHAQKNRLFYIYQMIKHSLRQLQRYQKILDLDVNPIIAVKKRTINLPQLLIERSIEFQSITNSKGITIHVYSDRDKNAENIEVDKDLLEEVMNNLIDNAVKYSFTRSQLEAKGIKYNDNYHRSDGNILIYYLIEPDKTILKVTSWGATILKNEKTRIFERHFRGEDANQFSLIGSGIGLFLVKRILNAMNSQIKVSSEKYKTTFTILIKK